MPQDIQQWVDLLKGMGVSLGAFLLWWYVGRKKMLSSSRDLSVKARNFKAEDAIDTAELINRMITQLSDEMNKNNTLVVSLADSVGENMKLKLFIQKIKQDCPECLACIEKLKDVYKELVVELDEQGRKEQED